MIADLILVWPGNLLFGPPRSRDKVDEPNGEFKEAMSTPRTHTRTHTQRTAHDKKERFMNFTPVEIVHQSCNLNRF